MTWSTAISQRVMEQIGRAPVAIDRGNGEVFVAWRMLGTDPDEVAFDVFRNGEKANEELITTRTNFIFSPGGISTSDEYQVIAYVNGFPTDSSKIVNPWGDFYTSIPLSPPSGGTSPDGWQYSYSANDASVGDLDNDGEYEIVLKWNPNNAKDNAQQGYTGPTILEGLEMDGTSLWRINLGINIRSGAHYTQFMVYDLDGDGIAEVACKTADGSTDGQGKVIGEATADYRNGAGYILDGPEYLTIFNGQTGAELVTTDYTPARGNVGAWGDSYGNRVDRFLACIAYLDGERPSLVMCRGYYTRTVLAAYDYRGGELTQRWVFDSDEGYDSYRGQGAHSISVGDADGDGKDEILYGAAAIDDDGTGLYTTGMGHGDATHLADIDPESPGLEFFMPHESSLGTTFRPNFSVRNAGTGEMNWVHTGGGGDIGRGVTADLDPASPGMEVWSSDGSGVWSADGNVISNNYPRSTGDGWSYNFTIWWDGDLQREIFDRGVINKWVPSGSNRLATLYNYGGSTNNGSKSNPTLQADLVGDWREEIILRNPESTALLMFANTDPSEHKLRTLMHDSEYRLAIAWQNVAYNQPPHTGFFLGADMEMPEQPDIVIGACGQELTPVDPGAYTSSLLEFLDLSLEDISSWYMPKGSSLILFEEDDFNGNYDVIRYTGSCEIEQPSKTYQSVIVSDKTFYPELEFVIRSKSTDKAISVDAGAENDGAAILAQEYVQRPYQAWNIQQVEGQYYSFSAVHSDLLMQIQFDIVPEQKEPGEPILESQQFEIVMAPGSTSYFFIRNKENGKCLQVDQSSEVISCEVCDATNEDQMFYEEIFEEGEVKEVLGGLLNDSDKIRLYPNPIKDLLQFEGGSVEQIEVYNTNGQLVLHRQLSGALSADLSELNQGIYLVRVKSEFGTVMRKILKE